MYSGSDRWGEYDADYVVGAGVFAEQCSTQQPLVTTTDGSPQEAPSILSLDDNPSLDCR